MNPNQVIDVLAAAGWVVIVLFLVLVGWAMVVHYRHATKPPRNADKPRVKVVK